MDPNGGDASYKSAIHRIVNKLWTRAAISRHQIFCSFVRARSYRSCSLTSEPSRRPETSKESLELIVSSYSSEVMKSGDQVNQMQHIRYLKKMSAGSAAQRHK